MKHIKFNTPIAREIEVIGVESFNIDITPLDPLFAAVEGLEQLYNEWSTYGVSKQSFKRISEFVPANESIDLRGSFGDNLSIKGLSIALEENVNQREGIFSKIIKFFSEKIKAFVAWAKKRFARIADIWKKMRANKFKPNLKVLKFISGIFKNKKAFTEAVVNSVDKDKQDECKEAVSAIVDEFADKLNDRFKELNSNLYAKFIFFNLRGVEEFFSKFDRYNLDIERIMGVMSSLDSIKKSGNGTDVIKRLKDLLNTVDTKLPNDDWFTNKSINKTTYERKIINLSDTDLIEFGNEIQKLLGANATLLGDCVGIGARFDKIIKLLSDDYLGNLHTSYNNLGADVEETCMDITREVLKRTIGITTSIQLEYVELSNVTSTLLMIDDLVISVVVSQTKLMASKVIDVVEGDTEAVSKVLKDITGVDLNEKNPESTSGDLDASIDTTAPGSGKESYHDGYNFNDIEETATSLESLMDYELINYANDCINCAGIYSIANESGEEKKKSIVKRFIEWISKKLAAIRDYLMNKFNSISDRLKGFTKKDINVANRIDETGLNPEKINQKVEEVVKKTGIDPEVFENFKEQSKQTINSMIESVNSKIKNNKFTTCLLYCPDEFVGEFYEPVQHYSIKLDKVFNSAITVINNPGVSFEAINEACDELQDVIKGNNGESQIKHYEAILDKISKDADSEKQSLKIKLTKTYYAAFAHRSYLHQTVIKSYIKHMNNNLNGFDLLSKNYNTGNLEHIKNIDKIFACLSEAAVVTSNCVKYITQFLEACAVAEEVSKRLTSGLEDVADKLPKEISYSISDQIRTQLGIHK